jgi:hypothetical protein
MQHRRIILGLAAVLAAALLVPSAASARPFKVSHDVGVYAGTNSTSKGLATVKAGGTVDVQCWTTGQSIGGYAIWDRVSVRNISGYVHDKYVEMPNKTSPAANGIPQCKGGGQPAPKPGSARCAALSKAWIQYLAVVNDADRFKSENWFSLVRVKWAPRFCPRGNSGDYSIEGTPEVREFKNPVNFFTEFEPGEGVQSADGKRIVYDGRLRACALGVCGTAGRTRIIATLTSQGVRIDRSVHTLELGENLSGDHLGWRHKQDQEGKPR